MNRALIGIVAIVVVLGGCRALVGIDDLQQEPPARNDRDGGGGNGNPDGGGPGPGGDTKDADPTFANLCKPQGKDCPKCCKENVSALHGVFEGDGVGGACLCEPGPEKCAAFCTPDAGGACKAGPLPTTQPGEPDDCVKCVDRNLRSANGACNKACAGDPACLAGLLCMQSCPAL